MIDYGCFMPLSILFQSFTTPVPDRGTGGGGFRRLMFYATFNIVSVIYHTCAVDRPREFRKHIHTPPDYKEALLLAVLVLMWRFWLNFDY